MFSLCRFYSNPNDYKLTTQVQFIANWKSFIPTGWKHTRASDLSAV